MDIKEIIGKLWSYLKVAGKYLLEAAIFIGKFLVALFKLMQEAFTKLFSSLHAGEKLSQSKLFAKLSIKADGEKINKVLSSLLCILTVIILGVTLVAAVGGGGSKSSGGTDFFAKDCISCSGSGNCSNCGGSGQKNEWTGREYMYLNCTFCGGTGRCSFCYGSGKG